MSEFIKVTKDGQEIEIHPDALADHKRLGWVVVEDALKAEEVLPVQVEKPVEKKARK